MRVSKVLGRGFLCCAVALMGCEPGDEAVSAAVVERTQLGDTMVVRNLSGSVWGDSTRLVEETVIGVLEGPVEYQFGAIQDLAVDASGGIYVFDGQVPAIRHYDASGSYVRTVGGEGEGPGEYKDAVLGLAVRRSDGRLVMRDPRNMRLNVYNADGSPSESWRVESGLFTSGAMVLDTADHMYLKILTGRPEPNMTWPIALLHMSAAGEILDTVIPPTLPNEPADQNGVFATGKVWAMSPLGGIVVAVSDRYVIDHRRDDGTVLRIVREAQPAAVLPDERAEYEARNAWTRKTQGQFMTSDIPAVPGVKPLFRSIAVGDDGRIWVRRYVQAVKGEAVQPAGRPGTEPPPPVTWREPVVFDVFEVDGAFLGSVRVPPRTSLSVFRGERVWGIRRGEFDESYVVAFRIEH